MVETDPDHTTIRAVTQALFFEKTGYRNIVALNVTTSPLMPPVLSNGGSRY